ncbi:recombinase family protein [Sphingomonas sp. LY54]|uniref:recombinase family protein n=1 Tax=Sphingomonas sp. LY54 TaxID=3095343 RepID=UPI002D77AA90|nr:recombinase family protein [Sphingomonas sp. LY54]WRP29027.1 recombinase family protein [Sphingomonas sp. LY54]
MRKFDGIIIENLSRLTRDVEDAAYTMKRAEFHGVKLYPANDNGSPVSGDMANFQAMMAEMARKQGAQMIHRSMSGLVLGGKSAGGKSYGYRSKARRPGERGGELEVVEEEAEIVREIFVRYVAGESPRAIITDLNRRGIPSPRAGIKRKDGSLTTGRWRDSTLNGNKDRETGILFNPLYAGVRKWNRTKHMKHPDTASRVSRVNSKDQWTIMGVPELAIIKPEIWEAAQNRKADRSFKQNTRQAQRAKRLFSGLLRCGSCGSTINSNGVDAKTGKPRVQCAGNASQGICDNPVRAYVEDIEGVVLTALRANLADTRLMNAYIDAYMAERKRLARQAVNEHDTINKGLAEVERKMERLKKAYMAGVIELEQFGADNAPLKDEKAALVAKLAVVDGPASAISFHPAAVASFKNALADLNSVLCEDGERPSAKLIRSVVDRVIVTPAEKKPKSPFERRSMRVEIIGGLDALLNGTAVDRCAALPVRDGSGSGGGT